MKKFTAILLSFAIMISFVSGLAIQAETEDSYYTPDGITVGNTLGSIPTWMTFNVTYGDKATDGYIAKINSNYNTSASTGNIYIKLPSSIWNTPINKLAFSFKCTDGTWGTRGSYVYLAPSISNFSSKGIAIKNWFSFGKAGTTLTIDLSLDTYANAVSGKYCYLILGNGGSANYYTGTEMLLTDVLVYGGEIVYPKATFKGASTGDFEITADSNFQVTLPTATVENGNFLGWTLDGNTLLKEGNTVALTKDLTYYAVSDVKATQTAPDAPTLNSKTDSSVTLNAVTNCEYSIDGEIWQESTLFENLRASTEYTFYQRYKGNLLYDVSDKSSGLTVTTDSEQTIFEFEAENTYNSAVVGTVKTASYSDTGSSSKYTYVAHDESNVNVGDSIEYTFSGLKPGSYLIEMYARCTATRSTYSLTAYDSSNKNQDLGSVNFADWYSQNRVSGFEYYCKSTLPTNAVVSNGDSFTLKFTITTASSSGSCIDKFVLTKVETDGTTTEAISTEDKASIRLGETINGIRFYTTVVASNLTTLVGSNEYELGTLIGPADKIGTYLTYDDVTSGNAVDVKYQYKESGKYVYHTDTTDSSKQSIVGSLVSIKDTNYNRSFVARGYVKVKNADDTYTYYYSSKTSTRTIAGIADAFIADTSSDYHIEGALTPTVKALVDAWAAANN